MPPQTPVSVAMIVRNESRLFPECFAHHAALWAEWCIVDTGSTDDTPRMAQEHGHQFASFTWCDDFAAARNAALALCTQPWIFILDADERLSNQGIAEIQRLAASGPDRAYRFETRNYTHAETLTGFQACAPDDPFARGHQGWHPSYKVRLFPNRDDIRFEGNVHELVEPALRRLSIPIQRVQYPVHHYPQLRPDEEITRKHELYLRLGRLKIDAAPNDPKAYIEFANQCSEVGAYESAAAAYREGLALDPNYPDAWKDLGGVLHLMGRGEDAEQALRIALRFDPDSHGAWRNLGVVLATAHQYDKAIEALKNAIRLNPEWSKGWLYIAEAHDRAGRNEAAQKARARTHLN